MIAIIGSATFWGFVLLSSALLFPVACVIRLSTFPFDRKLVALHRFSSFWGSLYTWCNPLWKVTIETIQPVPPGKAFVIVSNHQSLVDILVIFRLRLHYKWVSKAENFRIPFIGWNMSLNRYISIDRQSLRGHLGMMRACERTLDEGSSIMIFPEGTRSPDGRLRPFKDGAFELALRTRHDVLPIVISGTAHALPKRGIILRGKHRIGLRVLPPVQSEDFIHLSAGELNQRIHCIIEEELRKMRAVQEPESPPVTVSR
jgi:1-acyl-sn-glycerol-3-phosphate acyltransferase